MSLFKRIGFYVTAVLSILILSISVQPVAAANNLYVDDSVGTDTIVGIPNNCQMSYAPPIPNFPCRTVKHAVGQASSGDTIYIDGSFTETYIFITKNLTIASSGGSSSHISGGNGGRIFEISSGDTLNLHNVYLRDGLASIGGAVLNYGTFNMDDGYITNSQANQGGALYNTIEARATLSSVWVEGNQTTIGEGGAVYNEGTFTANEGTAFVDNSAATLGGAIFNKESGTVGFDNGHILSSTAEHGGGIHNMGGYVGLFDSSILYSTAVYNGGALVNALGRIWLDGTEIEHNSAQNGGGIYNTMVNDNNNAYIIDSLIHDNTATLNGGGMFQLSSNANTYLIRSEFSKNKADANGGALFLNGSGVVTIEGSQEAISLFEQNTAVYDGGAIYNKLTLHIDHTYFKINSGLNGGAIFNTGNGVVQLQQASLVSNSAIWDGGAIYDEATHSHLVAVNATFSANSAGTFGGALYTDAAQPAQFANATFHGNSGPLGGGTLYAIGDVVLYNSIITATAAGADCTTAGGTFSGRRNLIDAFAAGPCSSISPAAVTHISTARTGVLPVHEILGLSNAYDNGFSNCPDPLNGLAPLSTDQQGNSRVGITVPCDIGAFEVH